MLVESAAILIASGGTAAPAEIAHAMLGISTASMRMSTLLAKMAAELVGFSALADDVVKTIVAAGEVEYQASMA
ncbi:hypothetical protein [Nocardia australiensis]|uniref:hypothetical protein n=1 Tax=Nocardia australiensis TaxID=2887191 RepID=UPI001D14AF6F|nr:hypothetical protein [Nocardia australiensis]